MTLGADVICKDPHGQPIPHRNALHSLMNIGQLLEFPAVAVDVVDFDVGNQLRLWDPQLLACVLLIQTTSCSTVCKVGPLDI